MVASHSISLAFQSMAVRLKSQVNGHIQPCEPCALKQTSRTKVGSLRGYYATEM